MRWLAPALCLMACNGLHSHFDMGGGGDASGGGQGGGSASGGGSATGGGDNNRPFAATALDVTPAQATWVTGLSGRAGEVYAITAETTVLRSTGQGFSQVLKLDSSFGEGIWVADDGSVFAATDASLVSCGGGCDNPLHYKLMSTGISKPAAVCGNAPNNVYAPVIDTTFFTSLWWWNGTQWSMLTDDLGVEKPRACAVLADGTVVVVGQPLAVFYVNAQKSPEHPATSPPLSALDANDAQWEAVANVGGTVFAAGDFHVISQRTAPGQWTMTTTTEMSHLYAVGGSAPDNLFFAGEPGGGGNQVWRFNGQSLAGSKLSSVVTAHAIFVASPDRVYVGGADATMSGVIDLLYR